LIGIADEALSEKIQKAAQADNLRIVGAETSGDVLGMVGSTRLSLVILDDGAVGGDSLETCRAIREQDVDHARDLDEVKINLLRDLGKMVEREIAATLRPQGWLMPDVKPIACPSITGGEKMKINYNHLLNAGCGNAVPTEFIARVFGQIFGIEDGDVCNHSFLHAPPDLHRLETRVSKVLGRRTRPIGSKTVSSYFKPRLSTQFSGRSMAEEILEAMCQSQFMTKKNTGW